MSEVATIADLVERMRHLGGDPEINHAEADQIICEAIGRTARPAEALALVEAFNALKKWYA